MTYFYEIYLNDEPDSSNGTSITFWSKQKLIGLNNIVQKALQLGHICQTDVKEIQYAHRLSKKEFQNINSTNQSYFDMIEILNSISDDYQISGFRKPIEGDFILVPYNLIVQFNPNNHSDEAYIILKKNIKGNHGQNS
jgi:hypothetical protein